MAIWSLKNEALKLRASLRGRLIKLLNTGDLPPWRKIPPVIASPDRGDRLAIAAIVKNEQDYIAEWILFHAMQGVSKFIIYDNGSTDGTVEQINRCRTEVDCVVVPWRSFTLPVRRRPSVQHLAYAHALCNFGSSARWMAFIDVDEFLFAPSGVPLPQALKHFADLPSISIPWTNFGPNGHKAKPEGLVIENYTECAPHPLHPKQRSLLRYKTIVDPSRIAGLGGHTFPVRDLGNVVFNERRESRWEYETRDIAFAVTERLRLNHYFTRSYSEIATRIAKGRVSKNGGRIDNYLDRRLAAYSVATARDETILQFVPELRARVGRMVCNA